MIGFYFTDYIIASFIWAIILGIAGAVILTTIINILKKNRDD